MALTALRVKRITEKGRYQDGGGLYLNVTEARTKQWGQRLTAQGRRLDLGLGSYPATTLAEARKRALRNKAAVQDGRDPLVEKRRAKVPSFREAAKKYHELNLPRWRSEKHARQWLQALERHAFPKLGSRRVDTITRTDVLQVLEGIWTRTPEQARRVRQKMRLVFTWCIGKEFIAVNPAGEGLDGVLVPQPAMKQHFRALHFTEVGEAILTINACSASMSAKLCMVFLIVTAARSKEARAAEWSEINFDTATWTISAEKMKSARPHTVPLSKQAVAVLREAYQLRDDSRLIFGSPTKANTQMSDMTLTGILRRTGLATRGTVHGFRSAFRTWVQEETATPWSVGEACLAHQVGNSTEAAYARSDLLEKRRPLMQAWSDYLLPPQMA